MKEVKKRIVREKEIIICENREVWEKGEKTKSKGEEAREGRTFVIQSKQVRVGFHFSNQGLNSSCLISGS